MKDPLVEMMRTISSKPESYLDNEAGELSELALFTFSGFEKFSEEQQNQILFLAYKYGEARIMRLVN